MNWVWKCCKFYSTLLQINENCTFLQKVNQNIKDSEKVFKKSDMGRVDFCDTFKLICMNDSKISEMSGSLIFINLKKVEKKAMQISNNARELEVLLPPPPNNSLINYELILR